MAKKDRQAWQAVAREWKAIAAQEEAAGNHDEAKRLERIGDNATKKANRSK